MLRCHLANTARLPLLFLGTNAMRKGIHGATLEIPRLRSLPWACWGIHLWQRAWAFSVLIVSGTQACVMPCPTTSQSLEV